MQRSSVENLVDYKVLMPTSSYKNYNKDFFISLLLSWINIVVNQCESEFNIILSNKKKEIQECINNIYINYHKCTDNNRYINYYREFIYKKNVVENLLIEEWFLNLSWSKKVLGILRVSFIILERLPGIYWQDMIWVIVGIIHAARELNIAINIGNLAYLSNCFLYLYSSYEENLHSLERLKFCRETIKDYFTFMAFFFIEIIQIVEKNRRNLFINRFFKCFFSLTLYEILYVEMGILKIGVLKEKEILIRKIIEIYNFEELIKSFCIGIKILYQSGIEPEALKLIEEDAPSIWKVIFAGLDPKDYIALCLYIAAMDKILETFMVDPEHILFDVIGGQVYYQYRWLSPAEQKRIYFSSVLNLAVDNICIMKKLGFLPSVENNYDLLDLEILISHIKECINKCFFIKIYKVAGEKNLALIPRSFLRFEKYISIPENLLNADFICVFQDYTYKKLFFCISYKRILLHILSNFYQRYKLLIHSSPESFFAIIFANIPKAQKNQIMEKLIIFFTKSFKYSTFSLVLFFLRQQLNYRMQKWSVVMRNIDSLLFCVSYSDVKKVVLRYDRKFRIKKSFVLNIELYPYKYLKKFLEYIKKIRSVYDELSSNANINFMSDFKKRQFYIKAELPLQRFLWMMLSFIEQYKTKEKIISCRKVYELYILYFKLDYQMRFYPSGGEKYIQKRPYNFLQCCIGSIEEAQQDIQELYEYLLPITQGLKLNGNAQTDAMLEKWFKAKKDKIITNFQASAKNHQDLYILTCDEQSTAELQYKRKIRLEQQRRIFKFPQNFPINDKSKGIFIKYPRGKIPGPIQNGVIEKCLLS